MSGIVSNCWSSGHFSRVTGPAGITAPTAVGPGQPAPIQAQQVTSPVPPVQPITEIKPSNDTLAALLATQEA